MTRCVPFEVHRALDYLLGLGLISLFLEFGERLTVVGADGGVVVLVAATTRGRLGVVRRWSWRVHRTLDGALVAVTAVLPLTPGLGGVVVGAFLEPSALILLVLLLRTSYRPSDAHTPAVSTDPRSVGAVSRALPQAERAARSLGHLVGRLEVAVRARRRHLGDPAPVDRDQLAQSTAGPRVPGTAGEPPHAIGQSRVDATARGLGHLVGRLSASARERRRR